MDMRFNYGRTAAAAIIGVMAMAIGQPASAVEVTVDFEDLEGLETAFVDLNKKDRRRYSFPATNPLIKLKVSEGMALDAPTGGNSTQVYGAAPKIKINGRNVEQCDGCLGAVQLNFLDPGDALEKRAKTVDSVTFTIINPNDIQAEYVILPNRLTTLTIGSAVLADGRAYTGFIQPREAVKITRSAADLGVDSIKSLRIFNRNDPAIFYIDDIKFDDGSSVKSKLVSFRAFIPGNNAPAAPIVFCVALPETTSDGVTAAPQVFRGSSGSVTSATRRGLVVSGDERGHDPEATSYRVSQSVTLALDAAGNPAGFVAGSEDNNEVADMDLFADDALSGKVINDIAANDTDGGDCSNYHETLALSNDNMKVALSPPATGGNSVSARFTGSVDTPFDVSKSGKGAIDWDLKLTIHENNTWELIGAHDGFPAYEIYVDGETVYESNPGDGRDTTHTFGQDVRKLQGPMDVRVNLEGSL